ncbi:transposase, partial [Kitasatospora sp. NPDC056181]|uniref:transposase n=1 Tax=Kitasatospora sp. NPDC056181 TaxID=3345737 RepID=UPI0035DA3F57
MICTRAGRAPPPPTRHPRNPLALPTHQRAVDHHRVRRALYLLFAVLGAALAFGSLAWLTGSLTNWALIEPKLTAWRKARLDRRPTGRPAQVELRDVFNAILYINRTGIPWKYLPHDFPNHGTVYAYYAAWRDEGINVPLTSQGADAAKKIVGRKRGILTDTLGLLLAVTVTAASLSENALGIRLLNQAKKTYPSISKS